MKRGFASNVNQANVRSQLVRQDLHLEWVAGVHTLHCEWQPTNLIIASVCCRPVKGSSLVDVGHIHVLAAD